MGPVLLGFISVSVCYGKCIEAQKHESCDNVPPGSVYSSVYWCVFASVFGNVYVNVFTSYLVGMWHIAFSNAWRGLIILFLHS